MTRSRGTPEQQHIRHSLDAAKDMQEQADDVRRKLQAMVIQRLIAKFGGVRKAAAAVGQSPGNFANLNTGGRLAQLDLLERLAQPLLE